jgi:hypothetical protein
MVKKEYMKPALPPVETKVESSILVSSFQVVTRGLDDDEEDLKYSDESKRFDLAW